MRRAAGRSGLVRPSVADSSGCLRLPSRPRTTGPDLSIQRYAAPVRGRALQQVRAHEAVQVAVEHRLRVARLEVGAVVLHELVRVEDVRADLAAEADVLLRAALLGELRLALLLASSASRERRMRIAVALLDVCERSFWHCTTIPVGRCVIRTAESVLFTCCPPAPLARYVSMRRSASSISTSAVSAQQRRRHDLRERRVAPVRRVVR